MTIYVEKLEKLILDNAENSDEINIISGYCSPDIIESFAKLGKKLDFFFGMYRKNGLTKNTHTKLINLQNKYDNLNVYIVYDYHVHTKCYIFKQNTKITNILVGSANFSIDGLRSKKNSELLVNLNSLKHIEEIKAYHKEVFNASKPCYDPDIIVFRQDSTLKKISKSKNYQISNNPFIAMIPLFQYNNEKEKYVNTKSGLNWGNQTGHSKKEGYLEAYLTVNSYLIDNHPLVFPFKPEKRKTSSGKITREYDPVVILWDDGTLMEMTFQGMGVERPTASKRAANEPYRRYPKQLTSASGGAELGEYIRKRMNLSKRHIITYNDLKEYGREYIELTYIYDNYYEANFSPEKEK